MFSQPKPYRSNFISLASWSWTGLIMVYVRCPKPKPKKSNSIWPKPISPTLFGRPVGIGLIIVFCMLSQPEPHKSNSMSLASWNWTGLIMVCVNFPRPNPTSPTLFCQIHKSNFIWSASSNWTYYCFLHVLPIQIP